MADRYVFFRFMANAVARRHGAFASFMPKPLGDRAGSGAHFNISLADAETDANLFAATEDARGNKLSELGYFFLGCPASCSGDLGGLFADGQQLQALDQARFDVRFHLGTRVRLLRQRKSHKLAAHPLGRRPRGTASGRQRMQSLSRRGAGLGGRTGRNRREDRPGRAACREYVPEEPRRLRGSGSSSYRARWRRRSTLSRPIL